MGFPAGRVTTHAVCRQELDRACSVGCGELGVGTDRFEALLSEEVGDDVEDLR
jgi:hypothetical protein